MFVEYLRRIRRILPVACHLGFVGDDPKRGEIAL